MHLGISGFVLRVQPAVTARAKRSQIFKPQRLLPVISDFDFMMDDRCRNQLIKLEMLFAIGRSSKLDQSNATPSLGGIEAIAVPVPIGLGVGTGTNPRPMCWHRVWHYFLACLAAVAAATASGSKNDTVGAPGVAGTVAGRATVPAKISEGSESPTELVSVSVIEYV